MWYRQFRKRVAISIKLDTFTTWTTNLNSRCFSKRNEKPHLHKDLSTNIHNKFLHNRPKQETTQGFCFYCLNWRSTRSRPKGFLVLSCISGFSFPCFDKAWLSPLLRQNACEKFNISFRGFEFCSLVYHMPLYFKVWQVFWKRWPVLSLRQAHPWSRICCPK